MNLHTRVLWEMSLLHRFSFSPSIPRTLSLSLSLSLSLFVCLCACVCACVCWCAQIHWHDFAFYDPVMYDSLRQLVVEAQQPTGAQHLEALQLTFQVQLRDEEGGGIHDLCINGGGRPVTPENVFEYVQQYTLLRMVNWCEPMLKVSTP